MNAVLCIVFGAATVLYKWLIGVMLRKVVFESLPESIATEFAVLQQESEDQLLNHIFLDDVSFGAVLGMLMGAIAVGSAVETYSGYRSRLEGEQMTQEIRWKIINTAFKFNKRGIENGHDNAVIRDLVFRRLEIVKNFQTHYSFQKPLFLSAIIGLCTFAIIVSYRYGLLAVGMLLISVGVTWFLDDYSSRSTRENAKETYAKINSLTLDVLRASDSVTLNNMEQVEGEKVEALHRSLSLLTDKLGKMVWLREALTFIILSSVPVVCAALAWGDLQTTMGASESVNIGFTLLTFFLFMDETHKRQLALDFIALKELDFKESMAAINDYLGSHHDSDSEEAPETPSTSENRVSIRIDQASLAEGLAQQEQAQPAEEFDQQESLVVDGLVVQYDPSASPVLDRLSFKLDPGIHGIIGESGCGKSSLMGILAGFVQPVGGCIKFKVQGDPKNNRQEQVIVLNENTIPTIRRNLGYIGQDSHLFARTILENVTYGDLSTTPDKTRLDRALELAEIKEWVQTLPNGIETFLATGGEKEVSGGQRQRIQLARLFYRRPRPDFILMDECMSALDPACRLRMINNIQTYLTSSEFGTNSPTTLIVTHHYDILRICEKTFELKDHNVHQVSTGDTVF